MKNITINTLLSFLVVFFVLESTSCKKDDPVDMMEQEQEQEQEPTIPSTFTQKTLFEKISYEQCGFCPSATNRMLDFIDEQPENTVFAVSVQYGDPFEIPHADDLLKHFTAANSTIFFPGFSVNRDFNGNTNHLFQTTNSEWEEIMDNYKSREATAGLSINSTVDGEKMDVEVSFLSNEAISDAHLSLYIYEDKVPESSPGAQAGANGTGVYLHNNILRQVPTATYGTPVNVLIGEKSSLSFDDIDLSGLNVSNVGVIAFLHYSSEPYDIQIINVQQTKAGENQDFD